MREDMGVPPAGSGHSAEPEPISVVSAVPASVPNADPTALSFWFPKVQRAGLPVPRTHIMYMPASVRKTIFAWLWGEEADASHVESFIAEMRGVASALGAPFFLRTDLTSAKHYWDEACFVADPSKLGRHVCQIAEYSEMAGFPGLRWDTWVLREMLPTIPIGDCPRYGNMPICKEFRFFVDGESIECFHPYWPRHALVTGGGDLNDADYAALCDPGDQLDVLRDLASRAGGAVGGKWSVDLLETERGWFLTDMAVAEHSFHWEGCAASGMSASGQDAEERLEAKPASPTAEGGDAQPQPPSRTNP